MKLMKTVLQMELNIIQVILILITLIALLYIRQTFFKVSIPGPKSLPIIGSYFKFNKTPHLSLMDLAKKYGNIYSLQLGINDIVVLNGYSAIKEALSDKSPDFTGRPDFITYRIMGDRGIAFMDQSEYWKIGRKELMKIVISFSNPRHELYLDTIKEATNNLISFFYETKGHYCDPTKAITIAMGHLLLRLSLKDCTEKEIYEFADMINVRDFSDASGPMVFIDHFPWLSPLLKYHPMIQKLMKRFRLFEEFCSRVLKKRKEIFDVNNIQDVADAFLALTNEKKGNIILTDFYITGLIGEFLMASFDSSITLMKWLILIMTAFPEVQSRVQTEIDHIVGRNRQPSFTDRGTLPYSEATLLEVFRFSSVIFSVYHKATRDTTVQGLKIKKNTPVLPNYYSAHHDATVWKNPHLFDPTRFLNPAGHEIISEEADKIILFGFGGRRCAGENMAKGTVFYFFTNLMHGCTFKAAPGYDPKQHLKKYYSGLLFTLDPYQIQIIPRC